MKLVFATSNQHKLKEVGAMAPENLEILGLSDIGFKGDIPETHDTVEENSLEKAKFFYDRYGLPCFSEDTGLFIDALNGAPGVFSARYAGPDASFNDNIDLVLKNMGYAENRSARFKTVITYYNAGEYVQFEGVTEGIILKTYSGSQGFGYDPIFKPVGSEKSYAEMSLEEKNSYSHRKKSFDLFANHLRQLTV